MNQNYQLPLLQKLILDRVLDLVVDSNPILSLNLSGGLSEIWVPHLKVFRMCTCTHLCMHSPIATAGFRMKPGHTHTHSAAWTSSIPAPILPVTGSVVCLRGAFETPGGNASFSGCHYPYLLLILAGGGAAGEWVAALCVVVGVIFLKPQ